MSTQIEFSNFGKQFQGRSQSRAPFSCGSVIIFSLNYVSKIQLAIFCRFFSALVNLSQTFFFYKSRSIITVALRHCFIFLCQSKPVTFAGSSGWRILPVLKFDVILHAGLTSQTHIITKYQE